MTTLVQRERDDFGSTDRRGDGFYSPLAADPELSELVEIFVSDLPDRLAEICRYAQFEDWAEVRRLTHQLRGAGGSYGFPHLSNAAGEVEVVIKQESPEEAIVEALAALREACACARPGVRR